MSAVTLSILPNARHEFEEAIRDFGPSLHRELTSWVKQLSDSLAGLDVIPIDGRIANEIRSLNENGIDLLRDDALPIGESGPEPNEAALLELRQFRKDFSLADGRTINFGVSFQVDRSQEHVVVVAVERLPSIAVASSHFDAEIVRGKPVEVGTPAWADMNSRRNRLIDKKHDSGLTPDEVVELERLQRLASEAMDRTYPVPRLPPEDLDYLRRKLGLDPRGGA